MDKVYLSVLHVNVLRETAFVTSSVLPMTTYPYKIGCTFKGKEFVPFFAPKGANSFPQQLTFIEKGGKNETTELLPFYSELKMMDYSA